MTQYANTPKRKVALSAVTNILPSTCQLFLVNKKIIKPHGCSVLITHNSRFYCLSNSHVLDTLKFPQVFFLANNNYTVLLEGDIIFSEPILDNKHNRDSYDVAIMEILPEIRNRLLENGYRFLEFEKIETSVSLLRNNVTMIAAYPANKTKFNFETNTLKFNPLIVRTIPFVKDCSHMGFPKEFHHIVEYPKKSFKETSTEQRILAPQPHGMSGSGLWILAGESELNYKPYLIGILSEYDENRSLIFSTKIDIYISILKQFFDNTIPYNGMTVNLTVV